MPFVPFKKSQLSWKKLSVEVEDPFIDFEINIVRDMFIFIMNCSHRSKHIQASFDRESVVTFFYNEGGYDRYSVLNPVQIPMLDGDPGITFPLLEVLHSKELAEFHNEIFMPEGVIRHFKFITLRGNVDILSLTPPRFESVENLKL